MILRDSSPKERREMSVGNGGGSGETDRETKCQCLYKDEAGAGKPPGYHEKKMHAANSLACGHEELYKTNAW